MTPEAIRDAILEMDSKSLDNEKIQKLLGLVPTPEEAEECCNFDGDLSQLGRTENFFRAVGNIKGIKARLELFSFKLQFDTIYSDCMNNVKIVQRICDATKGCKNLRLFFSIILKHANYMNGGTKKGGVYGFKLSSLKLLDSLKSIDNKMTLMQYLVKYAETKYPRIEIMLAELSDLPEAVRIESGTLQGEINKIKGNVNKLGSMLKTASSASSHDRFKPVMEGFFENACDKIEVLHQAFTKACDDTEALAVSFGELKGKMKWEDTFKIFDQFCKSYKSAQCYWKDLAENEAKEKRKEQFAKENKERMAKAKARKKDKGPDEPRVADNVLASVRGTETSSIIEEIRRRRGKP